MAEPDTSESLPAVQMLNDLLSTQASAWTDEDEARLIAANIEQRKRWSVNQSSGSKKRVTAKNVTVGGGAKPAKPAAKKAAPKKRTKTVAVKGLKGIKMTIDLDDDDDGIIL